MKLINRVKVVVLLAAVLAIPAGAQQPTPPTPEERAKAFDAADKNKDGKLDKAEWIAILPQQAASRADQIWSARMDADGDGFVTREQFLAARARGRGGAASGE
jgi:Ca2+-binding EF-hand superfamily protein